MLRSEFEELITARKAVALTDYEWEKIETVYTFHPSNIDKKQTAVLYEEFGIGIFKDMEPTALKAKAYDEEIMKTRAAFTAAKNAYDAAVKAQDDFIALWRNEG